MFDEGLLAGEDEKYEIKDKIYAYARLSGKTRETILDVVWFWFWFWFVVSFARVYLNQDGMWQAKQLILTLTPMDHGHYPRYCAPTPLLAQQQSADNKLGLILG